MVWFAGYTCVRLLEQVDTLSDKFTYEKNMHYKYLGGIQWCSPLSNLSTAGSTETWGNMMCVVEKMLLLLNA